MNVIEAVKERVYLARMPKPRKDARTYVCHGDNRWGNSITMRTYEDDDHSASVAGWLSRAPFPQEGDVLLVHMRLNGWAKWVFTEARRCGDPNDMFVGTARGPIGLADADPQTKSCDEFIADKSAYLR